MEAIEAMQARSLAALVVYVVTVVLAHLLRWKHFSHLNWLGLLSGMVLAGGIRAWLGLDGLWAGMLVTVACVAPLYSLFELLGRRFPLDQARDVAAPDQAGR